MTFPLLSVNPTKSGSPYSKIIQDFVVYYPPQFITKYFLIVLPVLCVINHVVGIIHHILW